MPDLAEQVRNVIRSGAPPVTFEEVVARSSATPASPTGRGRRSPRHRRWWFAPIVGAAAILVAFVVVSLPGTPSDADALQSVRASPTVAAHSTRAAVTTESITIRAPDGSLLEGLDTAGRIDSSADTFDIRQTFYEHNDSAPVATAQGLSNGRDVYLSVPRSLAAAGAKPWIGYPVKQGLGSQVSPATVGDTWLRYAQRPIVELGARTINGVATRGYEVTVSAAAIARDTIPSLREANRHALAGVTTVRAQVWLDSVGRPVSIEARYSKPDAALGKVLRHEVSEHVSYNNQVVTVTVPSPDDVAFVSSYGAAVTLLDRGTRR